MVEHEYEEGEGEYCDEEMLSTEEKGEDGVEYTEYLYDFILFEDVVESVDIAIDWYDKFIDGFEEKVDMF